MNWIKLGSRGPGHPSETLPSTPSASPDAELPIDAQTASIPERDVEDDLARHDADDSTVDTPVAPPEVVSDSTNSTALVDLKAELEALGRKQVELQELFEARIRFDEVQTKALERLHDQLRDYKVNFIRQEMQPLLRDLIYCYDYASNEAERVRTVVTPPTLEETARAFEHLQQMMADVLSKYDVETYRASATEFDRKEQHCVGTVPTTVEVDDKRIAVARAIGFRTPEMIVRKEQVTVFKYAP